MYENEWNYIGEKSLYDIKKEEKTQFLLKYSLFIENALRTSCLMVYYQFISFKSMVQHADFTEYFTSNPN